MSKPTIKASFPNQKIVVVHREKPDKDFIQIKKENFAEAYKNLGATALVLYLYLVGNKQGYKFALSPSAVQKAIGMPESTCRDQINKLISYGYLVPEKEDSNIYHFYETKQPETAKGQEEPQSEPTEEQEEQPPQPKKYTPPTKGGFVF